MKEKQWIWECFWKFKRFNDGKKSSKKSFLSCFNRLTFNRFSSYAEPQSLLMTHFIKTDCLKMSLYSLMEIDEHSFFLKKKGEHRKGRFVFGLWRGAMFEFHCYNVQTRFDFVFSFTRSHSVRVFIFIFFSFHLFDILAGTFARYNSWKNFSTTIWRMLFTFGMLVCACSWESLIYDLNNNISCGNKKKDFCSFLTSLLPRKKKK